MNLSETLKKLKLREDQAILMICMGIAMMFWFFVKMSKTYETVRPVHIEYKLKPGMDFSSNPVSNIQATISGHGWQLLSSWLFNKETSISFDLENYDEAEIPRDEIIRKINAVTSLQVVAISPEFIPLDLDRTHVKVVPILLDSQIDLAQDYFVLDSIRLSPDSVKVWGPEVSLKEIEFIRTENLSLSGIKESQAAVVHLIKPENKNLKLSEEKTNVFIPVEQFTEKSFVVPVKASGYVSGDSIQFLPTSVELTLVVPLSYYEIVKAEDFEVSAILPEKFSNYISNRATLTVSRQPKWVKSVRILPSTVEYFFFR